MLIENIIIFLSLSKRFFRRKSKATLHAMKLRQLGDYSLTDRLINGLSECYKFNILFSVAKWCV